MSRYICHVSGNKKAYFPHSHRENGQVQFPKITAFLVLVLEVKYWES